MNKLFTLTILLLLFSCGKDDLPRNTIQVGDIQWLFQGDINDSYVMQDSNGISNSFTLISIDGFNDASGASQLTNIDLSQITNYSHKYTSTSSILRMGISAGYQPVGNKLYGEFDDLNFRVDLATHQLTYISLGTQYRSLTETDEGYVNYGGMMYSNASFFTNYTIEGTVYDAVFIIKLNDFSGSYSNFTIREFYVAKGFGVVKYVYNNGVVSLRQ